jgi:hypothetical protein
VVDSMRAAYTLPPLPSLSLLSDGGGGCYGTCRGGRLLWRRGRDIGGWRRGEATLSLEGANAPPKKCDGKHTALRPFHYIHQLEETTE